MIPADAHMAATLKNGTEPCFRALITFGTVNRVSFRILGNKQDRSTTGDEHGHLGGIAPDQAGQMAMRGEMKAVHLTSCFSVYVLSICTVRKPELFWHRTPP